MIPSNELTDSVSASKEENIPLQTAFIHLHSLISRDVSLPCPRGLIGIVQQLLIDVVIFYEQFAVPRKQPLTQEDNDRLALQGKELHRRLQYITIRIGERLMEAMLWAWLHSLLQGERNWKHDLARDETLYESSLLLCDFKTPTAMLRRIKCRVKDASALRRVVLFTFEALRQISTSTPPVYTAEQSSNAREPPLYCYCAAHCGQQTQEPHQQEFVSSYDSEDFHYEQDLPGIFTDRQLNERLSQAAAEIGQWKSTRKSLRRQSSDMSLCSLSSREGLQCATPIEDKSLLIDLQADFESWLQLPPLSHLRTNHRLERRHWSLEQLVSPFLTIE